MAIPNKEILEFTHDNIAGAARILGMNRTTLQARMNKIGVVVGEKFIYIQSPDQILAIRFLLNRSASIG